MLVLPNLAVTQIASCPISLITIKWGIQKIEASLLEKGGTGNVVGIVVETKQNESQNKQTLYRINNIFESHFLG